MDNQKIGSFIAKKRKQKGYTQKELAQFLSVSDKAVSKWERGASLPDIAVLLELAQVLHISVDEILKGVEKGEEETIDTTIDMSTSYTFHYTKEYHKKLIHEEFYQKHIWLEVWYVLCICVLCAGYAIYELHLYLSMYPVRMFGIGIMLAAFAGLLFPSLLYYINIRKWQETTYTYQITKDGIKYNIYGKEVEYKFHSIQEIWEDAQGIVLNHGKEKLFISYEVYQVIQQQMHCRKHPFHVKADIYQGCARIFFLALTLLLICLEIGYHVVLKRFDFELIFSQLELIWILLIIYSAILYFVLHKYTLHKKMAGYITIGSIAALAVLWEIGAATSSFHTYYSLSKNLSSTLVLKQDKESGKVYEYHYTYLFFAIPTDSFDADVEDGLHTQWITNDCNYVSYTKKDGTQGVYVGTYGDRGSGVSYYNVWPALEGNWQTQNNNDTQYYVSEDAGKITITTKEGEETFYSYDSKQFGTLALVLYKGNQPRYAIILNEDGYIDDRGLVSDHGTISIVPVMKDTSATTLFCTTYKENKEEQEEIDAEYRAKALSIVNKMRDIVSDEQSFANFSDKEDMVKVETTSEDFVEVSGLVYQKMEASNDTDIIVRSHGVNLMVQAGTMDDFYVTFSTYGFYGDKQGYNDEEMGVEYAYRIMKGKDGYLAVKLGFRVPGYIGLSPINPVIEVDIEDHELFTIQKN